MTKAKLYLDVDGVINAQHADRVWDDISFGIARPQDNHTYRIVWSPSLIRAIQDLDVEIVWLTTWRDEAPTIIGGMTGLAEDAAHLDPLDGLTRFPSIGWKTSALIEDQKANPSPFIWVDDEIGEMQLEVAEGLGGLPLQIDGRVGITPQNIDQIRAYIDGISE